MGEVQGNVSGDYEAGAAFYCEENNFDVAKAKQAFDRDRAFEIA